MTIKKAEFIEALEKEIPDGAEIISYSINVAATMVIRSMFNTPTEGPDKKRGRTPFARRSSKKAGDPGSPVAKVTERGIKMYRTYLNVAEANGKLSEDQLDTWLELKDLKVRAMSDVQKQRIRSIYDAVKDKDRAF